MKGRMAIGLALATASLAGCSPRPQLSVDDAWVRLPAVPGRPGAAYFTVHGGATDDTLISVSCDVAVTTAMHRSMAGPTASMAPVASVPVPAGKDVAFRPGGLHAMLFYVNPGVKPGRNVTLSLSFASGTKLRRKIPVVGAGDPPPE